MIIKIGTGGSVPPVVEEKEVTLTLEHSFNGAVNLVAQVKGKNRQILLAFNPDGSVKSFGVYADVGFKTSAERGGRLVIS